MALALTTYLEAVNRVLQMMGEAPVNSLNGQYGLAQQAEEMLKDVSRKVQTDGWSFNTNYEQELLPDAVTKEIAVGFNVSRVVVDPYNYPSLDVVQRGNKLYDRRANTARDASPASAKPFARAFTKSSIDAPPRGRTGALNDHHFDSAAPLS